MLRQIASHYIASRRHLNSSRVLLGIWLVGLLLGIIYAFYAGDFVFSLMRGCVYASVSIADLLEICLLPILLSVMAFWLSEPFLIYLICFVKAFLFGFCGCCVSFAFGDGGWIVRFLILFSDIFTIPALLLYAIAAVQKKVRDRRVHLIYIGYCCVVAFVDFWVISPFVADLF